MDLTNIYRQYLLQNIFQLGGGDPIELTGMLPKATLFNNAVDNNTDVLIRIVKRKNILQNYIDTIGGSWKLTDEEKKIFEGERKPEAWEMFRGKRYSLVNESEKESIYNLLNVVHNKYPSEISPPLPLPPLPPSLPYGFYDKKYSYV